MWKIVLIVSTDMATVRASIIQTDSYKRQRGYRLVHLSTTLKHDADVCPIAFIGEADMLQERHVRSGRLETKGIMLMVGMLINKAASPEHQPCPTSCAALPGSAEIGCFGAGGPS